MTFLQLCQNYVQELGLSGGTATTMTSVTGNTINEINNVVRWIHDAALQIDNEWSDWKYLWNQYNTLTNNPGGISAGQQTLPMPANGVQQWDINKFRYQPNGSSPGSWQPLRYCTRQHLLDWYDPDNAVPGPPVAFTINPDNTLFFSAPFDNAYDFKGEYWQRPVELINNTDVPLMPSQHHRIILCRAAVMYGNREDAPEIISGLSAELLVMMDKLQSDQLEGFEQRRSSTDRERQQRHHGDIHQFLQ